MRSHTWQKVLSIFLAVGLVFTCSDASLQPLIALADTVGTKVAVPASQDANTNENSNDSADKTPVSSVGTTQSEDTVLDEEDAQDIALSGGVNTAANGSQAGILANLGAADVLGVDSNSLLGGGQTTSDSANDAVEGVVYEAVRGDLPVTVTFTLDDEEDAAHDVTLQLQSRTQTYDAGAQTWGEWSKWTDNVREDAMQQLTAQQVKDAAEAGEDATYTWRELPLVQVSDAGVPNQRTQYRAVAAKVANAEFVVTATDEAAHTMTLTVTTQPSENMPAITYTQVVSAEPTLYSVESTPAEGEGAINSAEAASSADTATADVAGATSAASDVSTETSKLDRHDITLAGATVPAEAEAVAQGEVGNDSTIKVSLTNAGGDWTGYNLAAMSVLAYNYETTFWDTLSDTPDQEDAWSESIVTQAKYIGQDNNLKLRVSYNIGHGTESVTLLPADGTTLTEGDYYETTVAVADITDTKVEIPLSSPAIVTVHKYWNDNNAAHTGTLTVHVRAKENAALTKQVALTSDKDWTATLTDLPKYAPNGNLYNYELSESESYDGADTQLTDYIAEVSNPNTAGDATTLMITNTKKTEYAATKVWDDGGNAYSTRPAVTDFLQYLELYRIVENSNGAAAEEVVPDVTKDNFEIIDNKDNTWSIKVVNLPGYDGNNNPIEYLLKEKSVDLAKGNTAHPGTTYDAEYENTVNYSTITDALYTGGTLTNTLVKNDSITINKVWEDDGSADTVANRPTGTLYLYRYVEGIGSYKTASPVQGMTLPLDKSVTILKSYTFGDGDDSATLPMYDTEGRKYVYYVKEVLDSGNFNNYEKYTDTPVNGDKADATEKTLTLDNGTLHNRRADTTKKTLEKTFKVAAIQGHTFATTMQLQKQVADSSSESGYKWVDVPASEGGVQKLEGFSAETLTQEATFSVAEFDDLGLPITYRVIETAITIDGQTTTNANGYENGSIANVGAETLNGGDTHGYQIKVTVNDADGTITNTLVAQTDVTVKKVWNDDKDHTTDVVTATIKGSDATTRTVEINEAQNGSNSVTVKDLPRYDENGVEIIYTVSEEAVSGYSATYTYEDAVQCAGDTSDPADEIHNYTRTATITNTPTGKGTWIHVTKEWKDDGDADHRGAVKVGVYDATTGNPIMVENSKGENVAATGTLTANYSWETDIKVSNESGATTTNMIVKELSITNGETTYNTLYTVPEVKDALSGISADGVYDYYFAQGKPYALTDDATTKNDTDTTEGTDTTSSTLHGATITGQHVYAATIQRTSGNHFTITNTRVGNVKYDFTKKWIDGNNEQGNRPQQLVVTISRGQDSIAAVTLKSDASAQDNGNTWKGTTWGTDTDAQTFIPKYDENGVLYTYTVAEEAQDAQGNAVAMSELHYTCTSDYEYTVGINGQGHTSDLYEYTFVNTKESTVTPIFYKLWLDDGSAKNRRPDVHVTLYQSVRGESGWSEPEVIEKYINRDWTTHYSDYDWSVTFDNMPRYNAEGHEIKYYVKETMVQSNTEYVAHYYSGNNAGDGTTTKWTEAGKTPTLTNLGDEITANDAVNGVFAGYIGVDQTVANRKEGTRSISGIKVWSGLGAAWSDGASLNTLLQNCPEVTLTLYKHTGTSADGKDDPAVKESERISENPSLLDQIGQLLSANDPVKATLSGTKTSYNMGTFQKYDENGQLIQYYVLETSANGESIENAYDGAYTFKQSSVNAFSITNIYNGGTEVSLEVDKSFEGYIPGERGGTTTDGENMPDVEFILEAYMPVGSSQTFLGTISSKTYGHVTWEKTETGWDIKFTELKKYAPNLSEIKYVLKETKINGYTVAGDSGADDTVIMDGSGIDVNGNLNTSTTTNTPVEVKNVYTGGETLTATVTKNWDFNGASVANMDSYKKPVVLTLYHHTASEPEPKAVGNVTLDGSADGESDNTATMKESEAWKATWTGLKTYAPNGEKYVYTVKEAWAGDVDAAEKNIWTISSDAQPVEASESDATKLAATVTNTLNTVQVKPQKTWQYNALPNQTIEPTATDLNSLFDLGALPDKITFNLQQKSGSTEFTNYKNDQNQDVTQELKVNGNRVTEGSDVVVPAYNADGTQCSYQWKENLKDYSAIEQGAPGSVTGNGTSGTVNTIPVQKLTITKLWDDSQNRDGQRPQSISVTITRDDDEAQTKTITLTPSSDVWGDNTWEFTFYLPLYKNNSTGGNTQYSTYKVTEVTVNGYTTYASSDISKQITDAASDTWAEGNTVTLEASDTTATELFVNIKNYKSVNNSLTVGAKKIWEDSTGRYNTLDNSQIANQTFTLVASADGVASGVLKNYIEETNPSIIWTGTGNFTNINATWSNLPAFYQNGTAGNAVPITYSVTEGKISGWASASTSYTGTASGTFGNITVTNTRELTKLDLEKTWDDSDNGFGTRPDSITYKVQYTDKETPGETDWQDLNDSDGKVKKIEMEKPESGNWTASLDNLPAYSYNGAVKYSYRAVEESLNYGDQSIELGTGSIYTKTTDTGSAFTNTLNTTSLTVVKQWVDSAPSIKDQVASVTFTIQSSTDEGITWNNVKKTVNGSAKDYTVTILNDGTDPQTATISDLPVKNYADGSLVTYQYRAVETSMTLTAAAGGGTVDAVPSTTEESAVTDPTRGTIGGFEYSSTTEGTTTTVTNTVTTTEIQAKKQWNGIEPAPVQITLNLYQNGKNVRRSVTVNNQTTTPVGTGWSDISFSWGDLPVSDAAGMSYTYTVQEDSVPDGYVVSVEADAAKAGDYTVTNSSTKFTLKKVDATGVELKGAQFTITPKFGSKFVDNAASKSMISGEDTEATLEAQMIAGNTYTVSETTVPDGATAIPNFDITCNADGTFTVNTGGTSSETNPSVGDVVVNENTGGALSVTVTNHIRITGTKEWSDQSNKYSTRPSASDYIGTVKLYKNYDGGTPQKTEVTDAVFDWVTNGDTWTYTITGISPAGDSAYYTVEEKIPTGYSETTTPNKNGIAQVGAKEETAGNPKTLEAETLTNTLKTTSLTVEKEWVDEGDYGTQMRPKSITFTVQQSVDGGATYQDLCDKNGNLVTIDATLKSNGSLSSDVIEGLPQIKVVGGEEKNCHYQAVEAKFTFEDGKTAERVCNTETKKFDIGAYEIHKEETSGDNQSGFETEITNSLELGEIQVTKEWFDDDDRYNTRPGSATVQLTYDKDITNIPSVSLTLTQANDWKGKWSNLPARDKWGNTVTYTVEEVSVAGYTTTYRLDAGGYFDTLPHATVKVADPRCVFIKNTATSFILKKTDVNESPVSGATFTVEGAFVDGDTQKTLLVGNDSATVSLTGKMEVGKEYVITETSPAPGYLVSSWKDTYTQAAGDGSSLTVEINSAGELSYKNSWNDWNWVPNNIITMKDAPSSFNLIKVNARGDELTGSEFTIAGEFVDGSESRTFKPGESEPLVGQMIVGNSYTVTETVPVPGFTLRDSFKLTMNANGAVALVDAPAYVTTNGSTVTVSDEQNLISIAKKDQFDRNVQGATLELAGEFAEGSTPVEWSTSDADANPKNLTGMLVAGNEYTLTETGTPAGYATMEPQVIRVTSAGVLEQRSGAAGSYVWTRVTNNALTVQDELALQPVELTKVDSVTNNALTGATFDLYKVGAGQGGSDLLILQGIQPSGTSATWSSSDLANSVVNPDTQQPLNKGLAVGNYYFKETGAPATHALASGKLEFSVTVNDRGKTATVTAKNDPMNATVSLHKVDATSGDDVAGTQFTLTRTSEDGVTFDPIVLATNSAGNASASGLIKGNYKLEETTSNPNYQNGGFTATFTVTDACQNQTLLIGESAVDTAPFSLQVSDSSAALLDGDTIQNARVLGTLNIEKLTDDNQPLAGVTFEVRDSNDTLVGQPGTTNSEGKLTFGNLPWGNYTLVETAVPAGYKLDATPHPFTIGYEALTASFTVAENSAIVNNKNSYSISKFQADGTTPLAGSTFTITGVFAGGAETTTRTLLGNGAQTATESGMLVGERDYVIEETVPAPGYTVRPAFSVHMSNEGVLSAVGNLPAGVTITDNAIAVSDEQNSVSLSKVDAQSNQTLSNAQFKLEGTFANGSSEPITWSSSDAQSHQLTGVLVANSEYKLTETTPVQGYKVNAWTDSYADAALDGAALVVKVDERGALFYKAADNAWRQVENNALVMKDATTRIQVDKVDEAGTSLGGAHLKLSGVFADNSHEQSWDSAADTPKKLDGLLVVGQTYTLEETSRMDGYLALPGAVDFTLTAEGKIQVLSNPTYADGSSAVEVSEDGLALSVRNVKIDSTVELVKTDAHGNTLKDVQFSLFREGQTDALQTGLTTDSDGKIKVDSLAEGNYYFVETLTHDNLLLDPTPHKFSIEPDQHSQTVSVSVENTDFATTVALKKVDAESGQSLAGVGFALYKQDVASGAYTLVGSAAKTDDVGAVCFTITEKGTYQVRETATVQGYNFDANAAYTATFTVDNTAAFQKQTLNLAETLDAETIQKYQLSVENAQYKGGLISNPRKSGSITLLKVDGDNAAAPINNVEFSLERFDVSSNTWISAGTFTTGLHYASVTDDSPQANDDGRLTIDGLSWGNYRLQEISAAGYEVSHDYLEFAIDATNAGQDPSETLGTDLGCIYNNQTTVSFTKMELYSETCSDPSLGTGATSPAATRPLGLSQFTAYTNPECTTVAQTAAGADAIVESSPLDGRVVFANLPNGTYYIKETLVPGGHVDSGAILKAVIADDTATLTAIDSPEPVVQVINDVNRTNIHMKKVSELDHTKVLANATYGLYKAVALPTPTPRANAVLSTSDSETNGALALGKSATDASAFGATDASAFNTADTSASGTTETQGALQLISTATTGADGMLDFKGVLMDQTYVIKELTATEGSLISKNSIEIMYTMDAEGNPTISVIDDGSGTAEVDPVTGEIVWNEPQVEIDFAKIDSDGNLLAGATLQVVDATGAVVVEPWESVADAPQRVAGVMTAGQTYYLQELEAPAGYKKASDVEFTVDNPEVAPGEAHVQTVEMVDALIPESAPSKTPPASTTKTGDGLFGWLYALGAVIAGATGIAGTAALRRRKRQE